MNNHRFLRESLPESPPAPVDQPTNDTDQPDGLLERSWHLVNVYGSLILACLLFYALSEWSSFTTGQLQPGQMIFSNTVTQLWTAASRLAFIIAVCLLLIRLVVPVLFQFWRSDKRGRLDLEQSFSHLTQHQQVCLFFAVLFGFAYLFVALLQVNLPQAVSVGP